MEEITGKLIAEKRESLGWTQQELANYLKISRETVSRYESDNTHIRASIRKRIIDFFNISPVDSSDFKKLPTSGYYKVSVPFISTKSYQNFIVKNEVTEEQIDFITRNKVQGKFIAFEIDTKSMDNGSKESLSEYDIVLTKEVDKDMFDNEYEDGIIWLILLNNSIVCRLIEIYDKEQNQITCKPINLSPDFSELIINIDSVKRFYKVVKRTTDILHILPC